MVQFAMFQDLTPKCHDLFLEEYGTLTDEMFAQILGLLNPRPFSETDFRSLLDELDPATGRQRGYPTGGQPTRVKRAMQIREMTIPGLSRETKEALCKRLETGKRFTSAMYDFKAGKQAERQRLRMYIRGLKNELDRKPIEGICVDGIYNHPILGKIKVPQRDPKETPSRYQYRVVNEVLVSKMSCPNHDPGTLANIACG